MNDKRGCFVLMFSVFLCLACPALIPVFIILGYMNERND